MIYKMECPRCGKDMIYIENKEMESLGWISMYCPDGCDNCDEDNGYLVPKENPMLEKIEDDE